VRKHCERRNAEIIGPFIRATAADASLLARERVRTEKLREMPRSPPVANGDIAHGVSKQGFLGLVVFPLN